MCRTVTRRSSSASSTPAASSSARRTYPSSPGACSARTRGTARSATPTHPGKTTRGSSAGNAAALAAGLCDLGIGSDTGGSIRLPSAACDTVGLKPRWGAIPVDGVFPLVAAARHGRPDGEVGRRCRAPLVGAEPGGRCLRPRLDGLTVGLLRRPPGIGDGREMETSDAAEEWVAELERAGRSRRRDARAGRVGQHLAAVPT